MAEEQRFQEPHRLCANNCGFFGSPATNDLCSKCFRDIRLAEEQAATAKVAVEKSFDFAPPSATSLGGPSVDVAPVAVVDAAEEERPPVRPNRCVMCRKKVGLTGFECRCGHMYCGVHRYPEKHECKFDFKTVGREAIARSNPVVKAEKLDKI